LLFDFGGGAVRAVDPATLLEHLDQLLIQGVVPHNTALGMRAVAAGPGWAALRLPYNKALIGNPLSGVLHGGAITALLDATAGISVFLRMESPTRIATLDLRLDYLSAGKPGLDVIARAECHKLTKNVAFVRGTAYHEDKPDDPIATATATFMIFHDAGSSVLGALKEVTP
jgi:uncharacterized protein (TIGR00369 family)